MTDKYLPDVAARREVRAAQLSISNAPDHVPADGATGLEALRGKYTVSVYRFVEWRDAATNKIFSRENKQQITVDFVDLIPEFPQLATILPQINDVIDDIKARGLE